MDADTRKAYEQGVRARLDKTPEPDPEYHPCSDEYRAFVRGWLHAKNLPEIPK